MFVIVISGDTPACRIVYSEDELKATLAKEFEGEPPQETERRWVEVETSITDGGNIISLYHEHGHHYYLEIHRITHATDLLSDVEQFHKKFDQFYDGPPRILPPDIDRFRRNFMREELVEYDVQADAAKTEMQYASTLGHDRANVTHILAEMLDALCDELYVVIGTAIMHGFNLREAWRRVHIANMTKVKGDGTSKRHPMLDIVKPPGFVPPDHKDLVENHSHR